MLTKSLERQYPPGSLKRLIMQKTTFKIQKMDCASEESMIRMKLEEIDNIKGLQFDLAKRKLDVIHESDPAPINAAIEV